MWTTGTNYGRWPWDDMRGPEEWALFFPPHETIIMDINSFGLFLFWNTVFLSAVVIVALLCCRCSKRAARKAIEEAKRNAAEAGRRAEEANERALKAEIAEMEGARKVREEVKRGEERRRQAEASNSLAASRLEVINNLEEEAVEIRQSLVEARAEARAGEEARAQVETLNMRLQHESTRSSQLSDNLEQCEKEAVSLRSKQRKHEGQIRQLTEGHNAEIDKRRRAFQAAQRKHEEEIEALQHHHAAELRALQERHETESRALIASRDDERRRAKAAETTMSGWHQTWLSIRNNTDRHVVEIAKMLEAKGEGNSFEAVWQSTLENIVFKLPSVTRLIASLQAGFQAERQQLETERNQHQLEAQGLAAELAEANAKIATYEAQAVENPPETSGTQSEQEAAAEAPVDADAL
ncbi:hypothetical protein HDU96_007396, partial [Phlyctochytrium bullatum]